MPKPVPVTAALSSWRPGLSLAAAGVIVFVGLAAAQASPPYRGAEGPGVSSSDAYNLRTALITARSGSDADARSAMDAIADPTARKIALWALADAAPTHLTYLEADTARRDLAGWPHADRREMAAEGQLGEGGLGPEATLAWFAGDEPRTLPGALALAAALVATGKVADADRLIREAWRTLPSDLAAQDAALARFGPVLTKADHAAREDLLLYGPHGDTALAMLPLLAADQQALARARMAVRRGDLAARSMINALPPAARTSPGLAYERFLALRDQGDTAAAISLIGFLPRGLPSEAAAQQLWKHGALVSQALRGGNIAGAYAAAARLGPGSGADGADAEFRAGWIALERTRDPRAADLHFARLQAIGASPLTQSRAAFWRGRAAEAMGDPAAARRFFAEAARYPTTFYGQLAGGRIGATTISIGRDPEITAADQARFEGRETIRAARILAEIGSADTFRTFVAAIAETLPTAAEEALLVDFARGWQDPALALRVVRAAARRDFILPERGYPLRDAPEGASGGHSAPEPAFVLGIVRQESGFDPRARSAVGARGMMQLMPVTAQGLARRLGVGVGDLEDPDVNMTLGSAYLGELLDQYRGSYVMAAAAYNAGPGRPGGWAAQCGDPRSASADPVDFIECIPFPETRDYVMRVLEATEVYRARLNGGTAANALASDLRRGGKG